MDPKNITMSNLTKSERWTLLNGCDNARDALCNWILDVERLKQSKPDAVPVSPAHLDLCRQAISEMNAIYATVHHAKTEG